jgi:hypothetical protein
LQQNFPALYEHYRKCLTDKKPKVYFEELFTVYQLRMDNSIRDIAVPNPTAGLFNMSYHQVSWEHESFHACVNAAKEPSSVQSKTSNAINTTASTAATSITTMTAAVPSAITCSASTAAAATSTVTAAPAISSLSGSLDENESTYLASMPVSQKDSKRSSDQKTTSDILMPLNPKSAPTKLNAWIAYIEAELHKLSTVIDVTRVRVVGGHGLDNLTGEDWQPELRKNNLRYFALSYTLAKLYEEQGNMMKALSIYHLCRHYIENHSCPKDIIFEDIHTRISDLHSDMANRIQAYFPDLAKAATETNAAGLQAKEKFEQLKKHHYEEALKNRFALYEKGFQRTIEEDDFLAYSAIHELIHDTPPKMSITERHKTPIFSKENLPFIIMSEMRQMNQRHVAEMETLRTLNGKLENALFTVMGQITQMQNTQRETILSLQKEMADLRARMPNGTKPADIVAQSLVPTSSTAAINPAAGALVFSTLSTMDSAKITMPLADASAATPAAPSHTPSSSNTNNPPN